MYKTAFSSDRRRRIGGRHARNNTSTGVGAVVATATGLIAVTDCAGSFKGVLRSIRLKQTVLSLGMLAVLTVTVAAAESRRDLSPKCPSENSLCHTNLM